MRREVDGASKKRASRGFTLLEVLICASLLGALSVLMLTGLHFGLRAWERSDAALSGVYEVGFAQRALRKSLGDAYPRLVASESGEALIDFEGGATQLRFLGLAPQSASPAVRADITIKSVPAEKGVRLIMEIRSEFAVSADEDAVIAETLIENLKDVRFSYRADPDAVWRDEWRAETRLPSLIRIEADTYEWDQRIWPTMTIATNIDVDAECSYDPLTKYCRGRRRK